MPLKIMKNKMKLMLFIITLFILPEISADLMTPGYERIPVINKITNSHVFTNINDFIGYNFISYGDKGAGLCPIRVVTLDGTINSSHYYKLCKPSVYILLADKINSSKIDEINNNGGMNDAQVLEYFSSIGAKEVIKNLDVYKNVPIFSTEKEVINYYTIDLKTIKTEPDRTVIKRNYYKIFTYLGICIMAFILIIFFIKRKK